MIKKPLKLQASSVSRVIKCPGSMTLESKLPDRLRYFAYKDAAEYGTLCHAWGEYQLNKLLHPRMKFNGAKLFEDVEAHPRKDDILIIGDEYAERVMALRPPRSKAFTEVKFRATIAGVDCVAKSDSFFVTDKMIRKFDLKSGNFDYADSAEKQMWYASMLWCYVNDRPVNTRIETYVIQPAFYNEARRVVSGEVGFYNKRELVSFVEGLKFRQKEFNPGEHCKMCSAILTCKKVKSLVEEFFEMAKKATKEGLNFKEIYMKRDAVIAFLDALDAHLKIEMEAGKTIPGLYLEERKGKRRWNDIGEVMEKLAYLKDKIYEPRELKSPAQLEKIAGKENIAGLYMSPVIKKVAIRQNNFENFEV